MDYWDRFGQYLVEYNQTRTPGYGESLESHATAMTSGKGTGSAETTCIVSLFYAGIRALFD